MFNDIRKSRIFSHMTHFYLNYSTSSSFHYRSVFKITVLVFLMMLSIGCNSHQYTNPVRNTEVKIIGEQFYINDVPSYQGQTWTTSYGGEYPVEGLLMNARLVQGVFDDLNQETRGQWVYPDTRVWDPDRNTQEFIDAMASWREHGLLSYTLNLQGGCPYGYCRGQPWDNSAFSSDGSLRAGFMNRLERVLDRADELGMVVILGYFYFGQDENIVDENAVTRAVANVTEWVLEKGYRNVIIEINNECNVRYDHAILQCERVHELIELAKNIEKDGRTLYVSTSLGGGSVPPANIVEVSDFVFLHGNGVRRPERMAEMIKQVRNLEVYKPMPIVNNEDDQPWRTDDQGWAEEGNNFVTAVKNYASWGYFDFRRQNEHLDFNEGFQSIPANWQITSGRKKDFFKLLAEITDSPGTPEIFVDFMRESGALNIRIEGNQDHNSEAQLELLLNNEVIATFDQSESPSFRLEKLPDRNHWIRARLTYHTGDREVIVESPHYENPWWPYGGPERH